MIVVHFVWWGCLQTSLSFPLADFFHYQWGWCSPVPLPSLSITLVKSQFTFLPESFACSVWQLAPGEVQRGNRANEGQRSLVKGIFPCPYAPWWVLCRQSRLWWKLISSQKPLKLLCRVDALVACQLELICNLFLSCPLPFFFFLLFSSWAHETSGSAVSLISL